MVVIAIERARGHFIAGGDISFHSRESGSLFNIEQGLKELLLVRGIQAVEADASGFEKRSAEPDDFLVSDFVVNMEAGSSRRAGGKVQRWLGGNAVAGLRGNVDAYFLGRDRMEHQQRCGQQHAAPSHKHDLSVFSNAWMTSRSSWSVRQEGTGSRILRSKRPSATGQAPLL